ncbi:MAG TPA: hypothetical protein VM487_25235 [Phycisphaerae bacterium]|nr:hypothetical protein [Phycisphaerae bacterium]
MRPIAMLTIWLALLAVACGADNPAVVRIMATMRPSGGYVT